MFAPWIRFLGSVLQSQAYKQTVYVAAGSCCEVLSVEQVPSNQEDDSGSAETSLYTTAPLHYVVDAAIVGNNGKKVFLQSTFILPSEMPEVAAQHYQAVWDSSIGAYRVTQRPNVASRLFLIPPPASIVGYPPTVHHQHTNEEVRAVLRPIQFNWADEVEEEYEALSRPSTAHSVLCINTTASDSDITSQLTTPITPFSSGTSPTLPIIDVDEEQQSSLVISLDLATVHDKVFNPQKADVLGWLNLLEHDKECEVFREPIEKPAPDECWEAYKALLTVGPKHLQFSRHTVALDLASLEQPKDQDELEEGRHIRGSRISEWLDVHPQYTAYLWRPPTDDGTMVPDMKMAGVGEDTRAEDVVAATETTLAFEGIDLDTVFGGPADDLCEDYEVEHRAARASINTCDYLGNVEAHWDLQGEDSPSNADVVLAKTSSSSSSSKPILVSTSLEQTTPVDTEEVADWYIAKWESMCAVTQRAKLEGQYKHEPLQAADRSADWLWDPTNTDNRRQYDPRIFSAAAGLASNHVKKPTIYPTEERTPHHFNYMRQPVFHKTDTAPEVSLWAVFSGHDKAYHKSFSRQAVISAQAGKLIDPFWYSGPEEYLDYKGTQLRDAVIGQVQKLYHAQGTWMSDQYGMDEVVPYAIGSGAFTDVFNGPARCPQPIHLVRAKKVEPFTLSDGPGLQQFEVEDSWQDQFVNDDGHLHVGHPRRDWNWVQPPPSPLALVQATSNKGSNLELLSTKPQHPELCRGKKHLRLKDRYEELPILPQQSEGGFNAENAESYWETVGANVSVQTEAKDDEEVAVVPIEPKNDREASRSQILGGVFSSPGFVLAQRIVDAVSNGASQKEIAALQAQQRELSDNAPKNTYFYEYDEDEDRTDYTSSWSRPNAPSVINTEYIAQWSENTAAAVAQGDQNHPNGVIAEDELDASGSSPATASQSSPASSWTVDDVATPEDLELEMLEDESPRVLEQMRKLGQLPALPSDPMDSDEIQDMEGNSEAAKASSLLRLPLGTSSNQAVFAEIVDEINIGAVLLAEDKDADSEEAKVEDVPALAPQTNGKTGSSPRQGQYLHQTSIEEEEESLDRVHIAVMMLQQQADAQAEVLLDAYLGHLKRYHRKSWEVTNDKVSSLEVVVTEDQTPSEQKELHAGQSSVVSTSSPLLNAEPVVESVHDCDMILRKSYQYASSTLPIVPEVEEEDKEDNIDSASDLDCSPCGQFALEKQQNGTKVELADFEKSSEDMERDLVLGEDSEGSYEQDPKNSARSHNLEDMEDYDFDVKSVSSEEIIDMSTEDLDSLLLEVSGLLATLPGSENTVQDSPADLDTIYSVSDEQEEELDQDTLEQEQLAKDKDQLAEEARKLAGREKEMAEREEKLAEEKKTLAEEKAQLALEEQLANEKALGEKAEEEAVDHAFDTIASPSDIPPAAPKSNEHFFSSFAIAVGGKASKLALGLSGVLRSSATVLHKR